MTHAPRRLRSRATGSTLIALLLSVAAAPAAFGAPNVSTSRFPGSGREETAALVSQDTFDQADTVVLARADDFPDALAGVFLANYYQAPILLTSRDALSPAASTEIERLEASTVYLLGGTAAISDNVKSQLEAKGLTVVRIGGADRLETMRMIARTPPREDVGTLGTSGRTALIARADLFPDALAGGSISWAGSFPTILTDRGTLSPQASQTLDDLGIRYAIVLGGEAAVSSAVVSAIAAKGITTQRLQGATRVETATAIADFGRDQLGFSLEHVNLARGDAFPDALSGGPHAGAERAPILLTESPTALGAGTATWLDDNDATIRNIHAYGGSAAISDTTLEAARQAAVS